MKTKKRLLSILLSLVLALSLVPGMSMTAWAAAERETWSEDKSFTAAGEFTAPLGVEVTADITLTLGEGVTLTVNGGIDAMDHTLTIAGKGTLIVTAAAGVAGVKGAEGKEGSSGRPGGDGFFGNNIIIDGPTVSITGGTGGNGGDGGNGVAGLSGNAGGYGGDGGVGVGGNVTVKSGVVTITGGDGGSGGAGSNGDSIGGNGGNGGMGGPGVGGDITVQGGVVSITGGNGGKGGNGGEGTEYGGGDGGFGGYGGFGISGNVTVSGGMLMLAGGAGGKGGTGGTNATTPDKGEKGKAVINGQIQGIIEESSDNSTWSPVTGTTSSARYVRVTSPHTHSFTYEASGDTITATCNDTAAHAEPYTATLTLKPPANLIYDGKAKAATVEGEIPGVETPTVIYKQNDTEIDAANVKEKGAYTASVTLGGQTASVTFTITDPTYTIYIPAKLTVENAGWNATAGVTASGAIAEGTKLTVTAASENDWKLRSGENAVGYYLTTAESGAKTTAWEFTAEELAAENGTNKPMGAVVEEYINKPAGDYADTVTFTAEIRSLLNTITIDGTELIYADGDTWAQIVERNPQKIRIAGSSNNRIWRAQDNPLYIGGRTPVLPTDTINPSLKYGFEAD